MMLGCCDARARMKPDTASSATPQPVAMAPARTAARSRTRSGRAGHRTRTSIPVTRSHPSGSLVTEVMAPPARRWASCRARSRRFCDRGMSDLGMSGRGRLTPPAVIESKLTAGVRGPGLVVGHHDHRPVGQLGADHVTQPGGAGRVQVGGRLVQQQQRSVPQERAGQGNALALASGQLEAAFPEQRLVATGQLPDELSRAWPAWPLRRPRPGSRPDGRARCCRRSCR